MNVLKLYDIAEKQGITVDTLNIIGKSYACEIGDFKGIALRENLTASEEYVCMAHELGHHMRGALYHIEAPVFSLGQCEHKANKWAVHKLIPIRSLHAAFRKGYVEVWQLAEYFDVTEDFILKTIEIYKQEGKLPA